MFGALNQLPALIVIEYEDGVFVCMFEHHGFIVLGRSRKAPEACEGKSV